jgi:secondary thiamine-phosphate synthase enzyme
LIEIEVRSSTRIELIDVTTKLAASVDGLDRGATLCHVFVPHTTAAVVINEAADPDVARDLAAAYRAIVPRIPFAHAEGNSDSHLLATLLGSSVTIPIEAGRLALGTWQGVFLVELDGPRLRRLWISVVGP